MKLGIQKIRIKNYNKYQISVYKTIRHRIDVAIFYDISILSTSTDRVTVNKGTAHSLEDEKFKKIMYAYWCCRFQA